MIGPQADPESYFSEDITGLSTYPCSPQQGPFCVWVQPPGGALGQVSYGGVQLWGPNPYPILGKAGLRKHTLF